VRQLIVTKDGQNKNFNRQNLRRVNLKGANLADASFIGADLSAANLQDADLSRAKLVHTQLDKTDLTGATLTGAFIEDWGITSQTKFEGVRCEYVFMCLPTKENPDPLRKPDNNKEVFKDGDFADFIQPIFDTLIDMLSSREREDVYTKDFPLQGIWMSLSNSAIGGIICGLSGGLISSAIFWLMNKPLGDGLMLGLVFGLIVGLMFGGGIACIQHLSLRLILYGNGCIPWEYTRFLDYCTERLLLQRVGGRYRFMHKMLQDHFAQMDFRRD
jgi:uncharacterized protein YjbI with pentapeptide repeats